MSALFSSYFFHSVFGGVFFKMMNILKANIYKEESLSRRYILTKTSID